MEGAHTLVVGKISQFISPRFYHVKTLGVPDVGFKPYMLTFTPIVVDQQITGSTTMSTRWTFRRSRWVILPLKYNPNISKYYMYRYITGSFLSIRHHYNYITLLDSQTLKTYICQVSRHLTENKND